MCIPVLHGLMKAVKWTLSVCYKVENFPVPQTQLRFPFLIAFFTGFDDFVIDMYVSLQASRQFQWQ